MQAFSTALGLFERMRDDEFCASRTDPEPREEVDDTVQVLAHSRRICHRVCRNLKTAGLRAGSDVSEFGCCLSVVWWADALVVLR